MKFDNDGDDSNRDLLSLSLSLSSLSLSVFTFKKEPAKIARKQEISNIYINTRKRKAARGN